MMMCRNDDKDDNDGDDHDASFLKMASPQFGCLHFPNASTEPLDLVFRFPSLEVWTVCREDDKTVIPFEQEKRNNTDVERSVVNVIVPSVSVKLLKNWSLEF